MFCEEIRVPGLPGEENVTDGSVDWYEMDWENVDNGVLESEMSKCPENPCSDSDTSAVRTTVRNKPTMKRMK